MAEPGQVLDGRYRLDARIAAGGMGEVWRGTDLALNRAVAVKLLHPEQASQADGLARFRAEAQHTGSLSHPNIAQVYDYCEPAPPDPAYLVLELVDGPSLARRLDGGPISPERTLDVIEQAASGLAAAHRSGLLHRDIKPGNLLLSADGLIKITDFGIARLAGSAGQTRTGALAGTPAYLAPERVTGAPATPAADIYALGVVAHQCLTGQVPFAGEPLVVALAHVERDMPPLPPSVPPGLAALVADLTRKDPHARPASAIAVLARAGLVRAALSSTLATGAETSSIGTSPVGAGPFGTSPFGISPAETSRVATSAAGAGSAGTSPGAISPAGTSPTAISPAGTSFAGTSADVSDAAGHTAAWGGAAGGGSFQHSTADRHAPHRGMPRRAVVVLASLAAASLAGVVIWLLTSGPGTGPAGRGSSGRAPAAQQASPRHPAASHRAAAHKGGGRPGGHGAAGHPGTGHRRGHRAGPVPAQPSPTVTAATPSTAPTPPGQPPPRAPAHRPRRRVPASARAAARRPAGWRPITGPA